jgi:diphthamide synthase (EF-2-diphthine--ammonia ligase)
MKYALFWSGGKDSLLALDRGQRFGLNIRCLVNLYDGNSSRVRFHGVRKELIAEQANALAWSFSRGRHIRKTSSRLSF